MRLTGPSQKPLVAAQPLYATGRRLRACEWALISFFVYIAGISPGFRLRSQLRTLPFAIAAGVLALLPALAFTEDQPRFRRAVSYARDWVPLVLILIAYREMDWFTPKYFDRHLENLWIYWDRIFLYDWGVQFAIEKTGPWLPNLLEFSYLLVYAVGPFTVAILYILHWREMMGKVLFVYVVGTLAAYGLFPYFPSSPPRSVFPGMDLPGANMAIRHLNLYLVGDYGIHSSVFPSAHVSSAFAAAWAMLMYLPERRGLGWGMLIYAVLVSIATVYGRYHYAVDAGAGLGISIAAAFLGAWLFKRAMPNRVIPE